MSIKNQKSKREPFLALRNIDEYMDQYELFCGLQTDPAVFRKEMDRG